MGGRDALPIDGIGAEEAPEPPAFGTVCHACEDEDGTELAFEFSVSIDHGRPTIEWTARWEGEQRRGFTDVISEEHGAVIYDPKPTINGELTVGSKLPEGKLEALRADLEAAERYIEAVREAATDAKRAEPLELAVSEHVYTDGSRRVTARVLTPTKAEEAFGRTQWTEEERVLMAAIETELGTIEGYPRAETPPFADCDIGETFAPREVLARIDGPGPGAVLEADADGQ